MACACASALEICCRVAPMSCRAWVPPAPHGRLDKVIGNAVGLGRAGLGLEIVRRDDELVRWPWARRAWLGHACPPRGRDGECAGGAARAVASPRLLACLGAWTQSLRSCNAWHRLRGVGSLGPNAHRVGCPELVKLVRGSAPKRDAGRTTFLPNCRQMASSSWRLCNSPC